MSTLNENKTVRATLGSDVNSIIELSKILTSVIFHFMSSGLAAVIR